MNLKQLIGQRIKELRKRKGLSQEEVAEKADTSTNYLSRMERGTENPTLDMLIKLSDALTVELWELFDFKHNLNTKALRNTLKTLTHEITDDDKLRTAIRIMRVITR